MQTLRISKYNGKLFMMPAQHHKVFLLQCDSDSRSRLQCALLEGFALSAVCVSQSVED
jgi:hypothetical protein